MDGWVIETQCLKDGELQATGRTAKEREEEAVAHAGESIRRYVQEGFEQTSPGVLSKVRADGSKLEFRITVSSGRKWKNYPYG